jgi:hypothetical protein
VFPSLDVSFSVIPDALAFSTPLWKCSGFLGLGVCFGVEQGARIGTWIYGYCAITEKSPPIPVELSFLYTLVLFSLGLDIFVFFDVDDITVLEDIIVF